MRKSFPACSRHRNARTTFPAAPNPAFGAPILADFSRSCRNWIGHWVMFWSSLIAMSISCPGAAPSFWRVFSAWAVGARVEKRLCLNTWRHCLETFSKCRETLPQCRWTSSRSLVTPLRCLWTWLGSLVGLLQHRVTFSQCLMTLRQCLKTRQRCLKTWPQRLGTLLQSIKTPWECMKTLLRCFQTLLKCLETLWQRLLTWLQCLKTSTRCRWIWRKGMMLFESPRAEPELPKGFLRVRAAVMRGAHSQRRTVSGVLPAVFALSRTGPPERLSFFPAFPTLCRRPHAARSREMRPPFSYPRL